MPGASGRRHRPHVAATVPITPRRLEPREITAVAADLGLGREDFELYGKHKAKLGLDDMSELDAAQPLGRIVRPDDVAQVVRFLASADMLSGQRIVVDGGSDASPTG